jgi:transposase
MPTAAGGAVRATRWMPSSPLAGISPERGSRSRRTPAGWSVSIRMLRVARHGAVKARTAALLQARDLITTAPQPLREQITVRKTLRARLAICKRLRPGQLSTPTHAAKLALKTLADRVGGLDREIAVLDTHLQQLVTTTAPRTTSLLGIKTGHAGQFLVTAGENIDRLSKGESSFAALCAASPVKASSGKTNRHRLNPGGDRQANRALHMIAVYRLGACARTQAYAARRTQERQKQTRHHPLPQTSDRPRDPPRPHSRPRRPHRSKSAPPPTHDRDPLRQPRPRNLPTTH